jgi:hypothetical protein
MKNQFVKSVTDSLSEAEQSLKVWDIKYEKKPDGSLFISGDFNIKGKGLTKLPDLTPVAVSGSFNCVGNQLTSLQGAPQSIGGSFNCASNQLTSLQGAPQAVGGSFWCNSNQLSSLEHAPQSIGGSFNCAYNQLTSLEHAPKSVSEDFFCLRNHLNSLEHAPKNFKTLISDLGWFTRWAAVPETLRLSPETKSRLEQERKKTFSEGSTVLQKPIKVSSPLRLKK